MQNEPDFLDEFVAGVFDEKSEGEALDICTEEKKNYSISEMNYYISHFQVLSDMSIKFDTYYSKLKGGSISLSKKAVDKTQKELNATNNYAWSIRSSSLTTKSGDNYVTRLVKGIRTTKRGENYSLKRLWGY